MNNADRDVIYEPLPAERVEDISAANMLISIATLLGQMHSERELPVIV
jgi:hypothetical protein